MSERGSGRARLSQCPQRHYLTIHSSLWAFLWSSIDVLSLIHNSLGPPGYSEALRMAGGKQEMGRCLVGHVQQRGIVLTNGAESPLVAAQGTPIFTTR